MSWTVKLQEPENNNISCIKYLSNVNNYQPKTVITKNILMPIVGGISKLTGDGLVLHGVRWNNNRKI